MTEAGLGVPRLHESKDFSHGRFISTLGRDSRRLFLRVGERTLYSAQLARSLQERDAMVELGFERSGPLGALEALLATQYIAITAGMMMGIDISRPKHIPAAGLELYRWRGDLP
jgi:hypothetical protein